MKNTVITFRIMFNFHNDYSRLTRDTLPYKIKSSAYLLNIFIDIFMFYKKQFGSIYVNNILKF